MVFGWSPITNFGGLAKEHRILGYFVFGPDAYALELL
jgi:hypothetical protein